MTVLELSQPYPGDENIMLSDNEHCFLVNQIEGGSHIIIDQDICGDGFIDTLLLFQAEFMQNSMQKRHTPIICR